MSNPPVPNKAQYGPMDITDPNVIACPDLATFWKLTGTFPRVYDRTKPTRAYFAFSGKTSSGLYIPWNSTSDFTSLGIGLDPNGNPAQLPFDIVAADAGYPNVPLLGQFQTYAQYLASLGPDGPSYELQLPPATSQERLLSPGMVFTQDFANSYASRVSASIGLPVTARLVTTTGGAQVFVYLDARFVFNLVVGNPADASSPSFALGSQPGIQDSGLFQDSCNQGVGYPVSFTYTPASGGNAPTLTVQAIVSPPGNPIAGPSYWPTRPLDPVEKLIATEGGIVIVNTSVSQPAPDPTTADLMAVLTRIATKVGA